MTKPNQADLVRKALETAAALELAAQSAWEERSHASELFESGRRSRTELEMALENRDI